MADKIVQLIDKNGDNIFPVATVANGATITMTDTDPGEGSALGDNEYIAVYGGSPIIMDYSTSEVDTGAKWIDGSAIYKKTINFGALPNNTTKNVSHNISNLSKILKIEGIAINSDADRIFPLPFASETSLVNAIEVWASATVVSVQSGIDRSGFTESYITLYYTKSS